MANKVEVKKKEEVPNVNGTTENQISEGKTKKRPQQLYRVLGAILILIAIFFIFNYIFSKINAIEYNGLTFTKEKFGEIPVFRYYYYITPQLKYNLYLRNDPRQNNILLTGKAIDNGIEFTKEQNVYLSVNPEGLTQCEYGRVGISTLASFLADNQLKVVGAASNKTLAKEANVKYATCELFPDDIVINLQAANKTEILHDSKNCYFINIANCEIVPAVEKFEVQSILDSRLRRENK